MGTCTRLDFSGLDKNPNRTEARTISTFMIFLIKCQVCWIHGHLHAPRLFGTGTKSRYPRGQDNLNLNCCLHKWQSILDTWALASLIGFWKLATKSGNPTPKNTDSPETRRISEHTLVQPRTSSSDIEWGTPSHPLTQIHIYIYILCNIYIYL